ncbi:MAG TPA: hypothetical protein QF397_03470 [Candidatus Poseidoniia archaeon]|nr:hypothetical protein [Candidatus Poseidoniia archaeon]
MDEDDDSEGWEETQYESLDWGDEESSSRLVALYPATSKPSQAALVLIIAGFVLLGTATTMNGLLNDEEKIQGVTVKYNDVMGEMGIEIEQEEEIDEGFVRQILRFGMIWELVCAILAFVGGALLMMRQNYNMVLIGCSAAIVGLGGLLLSTLLGAIALYLTFQSRPEFGIAEQDESW